MNKYNSVNTNLLEKYNSDTINQIDSMIASNSINRSQRRKYQKALNKLSARAEYLDKLNANKRKEMRVFYNDQLIELNLKAASESVDNWKKSNAVFAITLKRKYGWSNEEIWNLIEQTNNLHIEMIDNNEWDNIMDILCEECDIELEVTK